MFPKSFSRVFQLWRYDVGHSQLLLRSPKNDEYTTRIDLGFKDVSYLQLPDVMRLNRIRVGEDCDLPEPALVRLCASAKSVFVLESDDIGGIVIAGFGAWVEDFKEYHEPSGVLPTLGA